MLGLRQSDSNAAAPTDGASHYRVSQHLVHTSVSTTEIYLAHLTPEESDHLRNGLLSGGRHSGLKRTDVQDIREGLQ
jgi:hypothetical protein